MKTFLILAFALILAGCAFANNSGNFNLNPLTAAQDSPLPVHFTKSKNFNEFIRHLASTENSGKGAVYIPDIKKGNARALKDFQHRFSDVGEAKWYSDEKGFYSYFRKDGFIDRAFYNKNGSWSYSIFYETEDKLPWDLRATVKSVYFDWTINVAEEIRTNEGMVYLIYMEDKSNFRVLSVNADNEMETINNMVKQ
jgi:hypothetical protein